MVTTSNLILLCAAVATALMAGLFYSWSFSVTPGLAKLPDREYIAAMQAMNSAILNPVFFAGFFGALVLLPVATYQQFAQPMPARFWFLLAATLAYGVGVFGVTVVGNVPLNEALAAFDVASASPTSVAARRLSFEQPWNSLNMVRTVCAFFSIAFVILGCLSAEK
ncbi:anthrone oxygenase family protein [Chryseolinea lacunae]|uniref:DUF1772 domain-containing protein n=1 Tax=Chryseolinea lacunae TaxID=2801331 RepID=A0ABS1KNP2_9BACT|nr:anthrone oxygenase family protein [Chryseolinea lacunae]MBL0741085.1 DUF1772 domain-containing protein [Chryseolinea lacunae]